MWIVIGLVNQLSKKATASATAALNAAGALSTLES